VAVIWRGRSAATPGPILVSVPVDFGKRPICWINAVRRRFTNELSTQQKVRFATRSLHLRTQEE
jgi:hypothetical protein